MAEGNVRFKNRGTSAADWTQKNPILLENEMGVEEDTNRFKLGDGNTRWNDLPYFITERAVQILIDEAIEDVDPSGSSLTEHINSATPHPVYDDGPSLSLLYQNAKV